MAVKKTIFINNSDYEKISEEEAERFSKIYGYWEVRDSNNIIIASNQDKEDISEPLGEFQDFGMLLVHYSNTKQDRLRTRRCIIIYDNKLERELIKESKTLGSAESTPSSPRAATGSNDDKKHYSQMNETFQSQLELLRQENKAEIKNAQEETKLLLLEERLKAEWEIKKKDLEFDYERKNDLLARREEQLDRREEDLDKKEAELEEREEELNIKLEEKKEANKEIAEAALSGLGSYITNTFLGKGSKLNGFANKEEYEDDEEEQEEQAPEPKAKTSFKMKTKPEVTVEEEVKEGEGHE